MRLRASEVARITGGELHGRDVEIFGLATDTRSLERGQLFAALRGPRFDGNEFVADAASAGAAAALVERVDPALPCIAVEDARRAIGALAAAWRERFDVTCIGITGSNGKTTVKEMVAAMLAEQGPVLATRGNLNNEIGVPLTLTRLAAEHRRVVVEMGANQVGEIAALAAMARPSVGVITCIAPAHLEGFGSLENVARAKAELIEALPDDGIAVLPDDARFLPLWRDLARQRRVMTFGVSDAADFRVDYAPTAGGMRIVVESARGRLELEARLSGRHNAVNVSAAVAVASALEVPARPLRDALSRVSPVPGRLAPARRADGLHVIDDSYNANPESLRAALEVLAEHPRPRWLVLGDMGELGADAAQAHRDAGRLARELGVDQLLACGPLSRLAAEAFGTGARHCDTDRVLQAVLQREVRAPGTVLVKGSRAARMERVVRMLLAAQSESAEQRGSVDA